MSEIYCPGCGMGFDSEANYGNCDECGKIFIEETNTGTLGQYLCVECHFSLAEEIAAKRSRGFED